MNPLDTLKMLDEIREALIDEEAEAALDVLDRYREEAVEAAHKRSLKDPAKNPYGNVPVPLQHRLRAMSAEMQYAATHPITDETVADLFDAADLMIEAAIVIDEAG